MPDQTYAELLKQSPMTKYSEKFGQHVPSTMLKYAANMLHSDLLMEILLEHIEREVPIEDWNAFAREFRARVMAG